jgi:hypothetical protein
VTRARPGLLIAVLAAVLALGACGGDEPESIPTPAIPTDLPTGLPTGLGDPFTQGTAHVELTGGIDVAFDVPLTSVGSGFDESTSVGSVSFADTEGNTFGIGGQFTTGSTSAGFVLSITTTQPQVSFFTSLAGECTVAFDEASADGVSGSFECTDLSTGGTGPTVDATGTFEASP